MEPLEKGTLFKGQSGALRDSPWLTADLLPNNRDTELTIEAVIQREEVKFEKETKLGYGSLKFVGKQRELGLNATNIRTLTELFGSDTSQWYGKRVALFVDMVRGVGKGRPLVPAVRVRAKRLPQNGAPQAAPKPSDPPADDVPMWGDPSLDPNDQGAPS